MRRNDFGGTFGGPVGRKDPHTFFFLSYEGLRARQGLTFLASVPTLPMRNGDFSQLLAGAKPTLIYDPTTTRANPAGAGVTRDPFPGNIIPAALFNSAAVKFMNLYPQPSLPGLASNYLLNPVDHYDTDQGTVKVDHDFSAGSRAFARFTRAYSGDINSRSLGPVATPYLAVTIPVTQGVVSYTRVFTPHVINQARVGLSRENIRSNEIGVGNTAQAVRHSQRECGRAHQGPADQVTVPGLDIIGAKDNIPGDHRLAEHAVRRQPRRRRRQSQSEDRIRRRVPPDQRLPVVLLAQPVRLQHDLHEQSGGERHHGERRGGSAAGQAAIDHAQRAGRHARTAPVRLGVVHPGRLEDLAAV